MVVFHTLGGGREGVNNRGQKRELDEEVRVNS